VAVLVTFPDMHRSAPDVWLGFVSYHSLGAYISIS
jgi:hypothetical protein